MDAFKPSFQSLTAVCEGDPPQPPLVSCYERCIPFPLNCGTCDWSVRWLPLVHWVKSSLVRCEVCSSGWWVDVCPLLWGCSTQHCWVQLCCLCDDAGSVPSSSTPLHRTPPRFPLCSWEDFQDDCHTPFLLDVATFLLPHSSRVVGRLAHMGVLHGVWWPALGRGGCLPEGPASSPSLVWGGGGAVCCEEWWWGGLGQVAHTPSPHPPSANEVCEVCWRQAGRCSGAFLLPPGQRKGEEACPWPWGVPCH